MIVHLSLQAERDLESIGDFIARDSPPHAVQFIEALRSACLDLADFPNRFPLVPRYERHGVRHRVHDDYLIFYSVGPEKLIVLHILHGARDYAPIVFPA